MDATTITEYTVQQNNVFENCISSLCKVLEILKSKPHVIVDDTTVEKLLALLSELFPDDRMYHEVLLNPRSTVIQFLSSEDTRKIQSTYGFALRLTGLLAKTSKEIFLKLHEHGIMDGLFQTARTQLLSDKLGRQFCLHSSFLKGLNSVINSSDSTMWIMESGLLDICLEGFESPSFHISKESTRAMANYFTACSLVNKLLIPLKLAVKLKEKNDPTFLLCLIEVASHMLKKSPARFSLFLKETNLLQRVFAKFDNGIEMHKNIILQGYCLVGELFQSDRNMEDLLMENKSSQVLLQDLITFMYGISRKDPGLAVECFTYLTLGEYQAKSSSLINWNYSIFQCIIEMLQFLIFGKRFGSDDLVPDTPPMMMQIQELVYLFENTVADMVASDGVGRTTTLLLCVLDSLANFMLKVYPGTISYKESLTETLSHTLSQTMSVLQSKDLMPKDSPMAQQINKRVSEKGLNLCLKILLQIINTDWSRFIDARLAWNLLDKSCALMHSHAGRDVKILGLCSQLVSTIYKTCTSMIESGEPRVKRQREDDDEEEDRNDAIILIMTKMMSDEQWEIRDTGVEFALNLISSHEEKLAVATLSLLHGNETHSSLRAMWVLLDDESSYVKSSVLSFMRAALHYKELWQSILIQCNVSEDAVLAKCMELLKCEEEAFPRRAVAEFFNEWIRCKAFWQDGIELCEGCRNNIDIVVTTGKYFNEFLETSLKDFDWEVRRSGLQCFESILIKFFDSMKKHDSRNNDKDTRITSEDSDEGDVEYRTAFSGGDLAAVSKAAFHFMSSHKIGNWLISVAESYDTEVQTVGVKVYKLINKLIECCKKYVVEGREVRDVKAFLDDMFTFCPVVKGTAEAIEMFRKTVKDSDAIPASKGVLRELYSFLEDVIASSKDSSDNLLDCY